MQCKPTKQPAQVRTACQLGMEQGGEQVRSSDACQGHSEHTHRGEQAGLQPRWRLGRSTVSAGTCTAQDTRHPVHCSQSTPTHCASRRTDTNEQAQHQTLNNINEAGRLLPSTHTLPSSQKRL
eukprot:1157537-Pelagomonas_calceolata.AAC.2